MTVFSIWTCKAGTVVNWHTEIGIINNIIIIDFFRDGDKWVGRSKAMAVQEARRSGCRIRDLIAKVEEIILMDVG